ncbi:MAG TPA: polysaccharide biosynthesis/export family protein [Longimicrobium sp.]
MLTCLRILALVAALALGHAPAPAQTQTPTQTPAQPPAQTSAASADSLYALRPGDILQIRIWREPDLSGDFQVDPNGVVTLPKLGERHVAGVPLGELRDRLLAEYRVSLRNPSITFTPLRRVQVLGHVTRPGIFNVDPTLTLTGVLALAGGANPAGDVRRINLVRDGQVVRERVTEGATLQTLDVRSGDQLFVGERSWFDRNSGVLIGALISAITTIGITVVSKLP